MLDLGGRTIASSPPLVRASAGEPYAIGLSGDTYFKSSTLASFGPDGAALVQARAAKDQNGALVALVAARIDLSRVQQELAGLELSDGLVVAVTDSGGRLVAMLPEMPGAVGLPLNDRDLSDVLRGLAAADARPRRMRSETGPPYILRERRGLPALRRSRRQEDRDPGSNGTGGWPLRDRGRRDHLADDRSGPST